MDKEIRESAARTAIDGFIVVERIYRHSYQTLMALKDKLKIDLNLKMESPLYMNFTATVDPKSWIHQFRGLYLSIKKISLEEYNKKEIPILFFQASLYNPNGQEPIFRYGVIERIFNLIAWKNARFDDYFRMTLIHLHNEQNSGKIKMSHCEAIVHCDEKQLLDIREDKNIVDLAEEIVGKHGRIFNTRPSLEL